MTTFAAIRDKRGDMKRIASISVSLLVVVATIFNAGCAATKDGRTTQAEGTALGAVGGALLGAALGAATGNRDNIVRFAAAGAVVGGAAGFAYGSHVAERKAKYVRAEDWLDREIILAHHANNRAHAYNSSLRSRVASLNRQVAAAKASGNHAAMRSLKSQIAQVSNEAKAQDKQDQEEVADQKVILSDAKARSASNFSRYKQEASSFNEAKAERGQLVSRLASLDNSLDR